MKLTRVERLLLANQMEILEALKPEDAEYYARAREALEYGYELEYDEINQNLNKDEHILSKEECMEVIEILSMFDSLKVSYEQLTDKSGIEEWRIKFSGFDGNNEIRQMAYAKYFCEKDGERFVDLTRGMDFNSHMPSLERYRAMLEVRNRCKNKYTFTKDDIVAITNAF